MALLGLKGYLVCFWSSSDIFLLFDCFLLDFLTIATYFQAEVENAQHVVIFMLYMEFLKTDIY